MANELLKNKQINECWLSDVMENQIYFNCLRIIFTIINRVVDSMAFHLCGHIQISVLSQSTKRKERNWSGDTARGEGLK